MVIPSGYGFIVNNFLALMVPLTLTVGTYAGDLVVCGHSQRAGGSQRTSQSLVGPRPLRQHADKAQELGGADEKPQDWGLEAKPQELGAAETTVESSEAGAAVMRRPQEMSSLAEPTAAGDGRQSPGAILSMVLGIGCAFDAAARLLLPAHGRRAVRDSQGTGASPWCRWEC